MYPAQELLPFANRARFTMGPGFGRCATLFLHLLLLLGVHNGGTARVMNTEKLSKKGEPKDNEVLRLNTMDVVKENDGRSHDVGALDNQFWIYDKKDNAIDNQFWVYDKKNDAVDNQFWIYNRKNDAVGNQFWIYDKKSNAVGDNQYWISYDKKNEEEMLQKGHFSSHINHMDPSLPLFFNLEDLKLGKTMFTNFPKRDPLSSRLLLPKEKADTIPFSLQEFSSLLQFFSFPQKSPQAKVMEDTLGKCEAQPIEGENKFCATSYESMLDSARSVFGLGMNVKVLSTICLKDSPIRQQKYTITQVPERISAPKMIACHTMPYPYTIFYCHYQDSENRVYKVSMDGENGDKVEAIAVCHMDTSHWSSNHISFRVLGIEPGTSPVCHFFAADHYVLVPSAPAA